jgi:membrane protease YdiL (CAAX protease family)
MTSPIPSELRTPSQLYHAYPRAALAMWITAGAIATIYASQVLLASAGVPVLVAAAASYALTALLVLGAARQTLTTLGLRATRLRFYVAAIMIGVTAWYIDLRIVTWLQPPGQTEQLDRLVERSSLVPALLAIAVLPALCEEMVFRGLVARAFARYGLAVGVVGSAALFSSYHLLPIQMVATFPLGLALGVLALRSGSIVPGMIAHLLNNATVIAISRNEVPGLGDAIQRSPDGTLVVAIAIAATGVALAAKGVA